MEKPVEYAVRNYLKGDEPALVKLFSECFGPTNQRELIRWHRNQGIGSEDVFVGVVDRRPVSAVEVVFKQLHHGEGVYLKTAGISGVCTDSDYRKKGIVTNLMKLALDSAMQKGASNSSLYTGLDIPAHRIYQRLGFVDVMTSRTYARFIDYPSVFTRWLRYLNRSLKASKIAQRKIEGWEKSVTLQLREVGSLSFRFTGKRFRKLKKPPKRVDIQFYTDLQTYTRILQGVTQWEDAVKAGNLTVKRGEPADVEMLKRVLNWRWDY